MSLNAKSVAAARQLGDIFAKLLWNRHGLYVMPLDSPVDVAIQYRSESEGRFRVVRCDSYKLARWLSVNATTRGAWVKFLDILDKKGDHTTPIQHELPMEMPRVAQRSMMPD